MVQEFEQRFEAFENDLNPKRGFDRFYWITIYDSEQKQVGHK